MNNNYDFPIVNLSSYNTSLATWLPEIACFSEDTPDEEVSLEGLIFPRLKTFEEQQHTLLQFIEHRKLLEQRTVLELDGIALRLRSVMRSLEQQVPQPNQLLFDCYREVMKAEQQILYERKKSLLDQFQFSRELWALQQELIPMKKKYQFLMKE